MLSAQSTDSLVRQIRTKYTAIRENLKCYDTTSTALSGESTEGGESIAQYDGKNIKYIEVTYYGETGKTKTEYYFDNGQLFFVFETVYTYNRPIYWNAKTAKENNDTVTYNSSKTIVNEDRCYFHQEKLIRWLDNDKKEVDLLLGTNTLTGQGLVAHANKLKHELKK